MESLTTVITQFAQGSSASCALPESLSADERLEATTIAAKFGLHTISYGTGDRRLHLLRGSPNPGSDSWTDMDRARSIAPTLGCHEKVVEVKNTFIHVEDPSREEDEREIWTMPAGTLQLELAREMREREMKERRRADTVNRQTDTGETWILGQSVLLKGLKNAEYNGAQGIVDSFDDEAQRYNVRLSSDFHCNNGPSDILRKVKVRRENIDTISGLGNSEPNTQPCLSETVRTSIERDSDRTSDDGIYNHVKEVNGWRPKRDDVAVGNNSPDRDKVPISLDSLVAPKQATRESIQLDSLVPGPSDSPPAVRESGLSLGDLGIVPPEVPSVASSESGMLLVFGDDMEDPTFPLA